MFPRGGPSNKQSPAAQIHQEERPMPEEEDALVLRMEAMILAADVVDRQQQEEQFEERLSFADSERFDEDEEEQFSAPASESSSLSHHWRGWAGKDDAANNGGQPQQMTEIQGFMSMNSTLFISDQSSRPGNGVDVDTGKSEMAQIPSLRELAARRVAYAISFELMEFTYSQLPRAQKKLRPEMSTPNGEQQDYLPEQLVLLILRHCFPQSVENIRLYSCLTNCGDRLFALGEQLYHNNAVSELFQIGYHLSAVVQEPSFAGALSGHSGLPNGAVRSFDVCIRVDRCRIVACSCSCSNSSFWCQHAVAACLQRIQRPESVHYRPAIWDSVTSLRDNELKKLAQYLINELPKEYIPVAQKLIDALKDPRSEINQTHGAPDPTAGPTDDTPAVWCMDERALHGEVRKTLINFMRPSAMVCEVQSLLTSPPALAHEWSILHRTFCAKQPESMWNLLAMIRVMLTRGDANGPGLLHIITEECLALDSVLLRWYQISLAASGYWHPIGPTGGQGGSGQRGGNAQQSQSRQLNVYLLCQELAILWRLVALNPRLNPEEREKLWELLCIYQKTTVGRIWAILGKIAVAENNMFGTVVDSQGHRLCQQNALFTCQHFPAFFPALQACRQVEWKNPNIQRLVQCMPIGSRLGTDIQTAQRRQTGRFPNLPFLRESGEGISLLDLVEMEQQLGNYGAYNPDAVVLPARSKRKKRRRKAGGQGGGGQPKKESKMKKEKVEVKNRKHSNNNNNDDEEEELAIVEQLSEMSSGGEEDYNTTGGNQQQKASAGKNIGSRHSGIIQREPYADMLDTLFAEAHCDFSDPFSLRFTCCEALFSHGYFREALQMADQLAYELLANPPNLLMRSRSIGRAGALGKAEEMLDQSTLTTDGIDSTSEENNLNTSMGEGASSGMANGSFEGSGEKGPLSSTSSKLVSATVGVGPIPSGLHINQPAPPHRFRRQFSADSFSRRFELHNHQHPHSHYHHLHHHPHHGAIAIPVGATSFHTHHRAGWLSHSHPRLMASSALTRETFWRTSFLAKLLLLGEDFMGKRRKKLTQTAQTDARNDIGQFRLRALELCLTTMRNPRGPAATKLLEMEINHLEGELCTLLHHQLELCPTGLNIVRSLAQQLINQNGNGRNWPNSVTVPPTRMAHYVVNALSYSHHIPAPRNVTKSSSPQVLPSCQPEVFAHRLPSDDQLALDLALQILSKDVHISETDHPLLCECIRRHRKDLQMRLLSRNRDMPEKLARVLETVLDPKVHRMYEDHHRSNVDFFLPTSTSSSSSNQYLANQKTNTNWPLPSASSSQLPSTAHSSCSSSSSPSISPFQMVVSRRTSGAGHSSITGEISDASNDNSPGPSNRRISNGLIERFPIYSVTGSSLLPRVLANQASEAQAHHMFEFAKSLLQEAGGNQSSAIFNPLIMEGGGAILPAVAAGFPGGNAAGAAAGPHRNLHICSLLIALYALGLNNECSPSWNTRTYSTHVSWAQAQALDIGRQALEIVRRTWRKHLTPTEVASLADKASQSADQSIVEEASQLALSVLPEANSLLPAESQKALNQCKERSPKMLEEACFAVEKAAERGGVYPEVLFRVAHHWYDLYLAHLESNGFSIIQPSNQQQFNPRHRQQQQHSPPQQQSSNGQCQSNYPASSIYTSPYSIMPAMAAAASAIAPSNWLQQPPKFRMDIPPPPSIGAAPPSASVPPPPTAPAPFYSPSIPPPPLPSSLSHGINGHGGCRLQPSYSAPSMATGQQQQQNATFAGFNQHQPPPSKSQMSSASASSTGVTGPIQINPLFPPASSAAFNRHPTSAQQLPLGGIKHCILSSPPPPLTQSSLYHQSPPQQLQQHLNHPQPQPLSNVVQISPQSTQHQQQHRMMVPQQSSQAGTFHGKLAMAPTMGGSGGCFPNSTNSARFSIMDDHRALQLLRNAHRVGIAAMNNLRSIESVSAKFAKYPPSCDEICWLLEVSLEIGDPEYVRLFCEKAVACVGSPFVIIELLRGVFKFFQNQPNSHRIPGTGQLDMILQSASGDLAKICLQQAKAAMMQHSLAGPLMELALHAIGASFNAACHKLNFNTFNAPDQEYVCELALATRDLFRLIPPYHEQAKRKYMDIFMEHCGKQKCFKKFKSVQAAVQNALQQHRQYPPNNGTMVATSSATAPVGNAQQRQQPPDTFTAINGDY